MLYEILALSPQPHAELRSKGAHFIHPIDLVSVGRFRGKELHVVCIGSFDDEMGFNRTFKLEHVSEVALKLIMARAEEEPTLLCAVVAVLSAGLAGRFALVAACGDELVAIRTTAELPLVSVACVDAIAITSRPALTRPFGGKQLQAELPVGQIFCHLPDRAGPIKSTPLRPAHALH